MLPLALVAATLAVETHARPLEGRSIQWGPCEDIAINSTLQYDCSTLNVPLDYTAPSNGSITLQLLRVPAAQQPSNGSVLFNFGGPGLEARNSLVSLGERLQASTGGIYDLVAFDPRGTANTIPFNCSKSDLDLYALIVGSEFGNASEISRGRNWAYSKVVASTCAQVEADIGDYIGTAFVARDLMSVVDALEEDGMLRYWGLSYGAVLGATVAAMFPDRIDRIIIDGVQNAEEYYNSFGTFEQWSDSDKVLSGIFSTCLDAGPELCPLAASYDNTDELVSAVWTYVYSLKDQPITIGANDSVVMNYQVAKGILAQSLYNTAYWPITSAIMDRLLKGDTGDETAALVFSLQNIATPEDGLPGALTGIATVGINCGDRTVRAQNRAEIEPALDQLLNSSRMMGDVTESTAMACANWKFNAKERYSGPWANLRTNHPMLIIGNTYDGHTPLRSAHNASAAFEGSVVLEVNGYGHCSTALISECATRTTAAYFVNGTLPEVGTVCPIDVQPYHPPPSAE